MPKSRLQSSAVGKTEATDFPLHVAVIMDGNGRWAEERGLPRQEGHRAGVENVSRIVESLALRGLEHLTLYAFSTENWERPKSEVKGLLKLLAEGIDKEAQRLHQKGIRLRHLGSLDKLPLLLQKRVREVIEMTAGNPGMTLSIAFNYGGRAEIVQAVRRLLAINIKPELVDEAMFSDYLYTAGLPDPDLVIRTAGEMRLSNFLLWQSAYSEYYVTPTLWPDFDEEEISSALVSYAKRQRRFGRVGKKKTRPLATKGAC